MKQLAALVGCQNGSNIKENPGPAIKTAVGIGTAIAVQEHPEWRSALERAANDLLMIEKQDTINFATVLVVVQALPVNELRSDTARIVFASAAILLIEYGAPEVDVTRARPVVKALREGFQLGLGQMPAGAMRLSKAGYTAK